MKINIDVNAETIPTDFSWQFGLGADHASQFQRIDVIEQLKTVHEELGFEHIRFHGILDDDMYTYQNLKCFSPIPGNNIKVKEINFRQVGNVYDNILSCGMEPFVEISFMPSLLASGKKTGLHYKNNTTLPYDYSVWEDYIEQFIKFLIQRYGQDRIEGWYFEIWNEPDLKGFFSGKQIEYFKLYQSTVRAIKRVDKKIRVGGPSTSACKWVDEFMDFCKRTDTPFDFITTHHYPGDAFGNLITPHSYGSMAKIMLNSCKQEKDLDVTMSEMFFHPEAAANVPKGSVTLMDDKLLAQTGDIPTFISEWNSMAIYCAPIHDEKYSAAFVIKTALDLNNKFKGYMFWCLSDIYEEILQLNHPFFGGFGIMSVDGIPKPNFWAFKMLSELYPNRIVGSFRTNEKVEYAVFREKNKLQVIIYAQTNSPKENEQFDIDINIDHVIDHVSAEVIDDDHCNPKRVWIAMGKPENLSNEQIQKIKDESHICSKTVPVSTENNQSKFHCTLKSNDIYLYTAILGD
ncbi:MAG: glycosyl hydrolase [Solobacterium sp.]|jgi:xylan 1,4-beta-xylosidase|nr:glycosyl hydrolase [Solobacterium sp.]